MMMVKMIIMNITIIQPNSFAVLYFLILTKEYIIKLLQMLIQNKTDP